MGAQDNHQLLAKGSWGSSPGSFSGAGDAAASGTGGAGWPTGSALIVVKRGPNAGSRFLLNRPVTSAGRHPGSDLLLDDVTASRRHVEFRREDGEFVIVDVGSRNGTYVNNRLVQSAVLKDGDEIQIGKFRLIFLAQPTAPGDR